MDSDFRRPRRPARSLRTNLDNRNAETQTTNEETFRTPEEVAATETVDVQQPLSIDLSLEQSTKKPKRSLHLKWPPNRRTVLITLALVMILSTIISGLVLRKPAPAAS